jgi:probable F420-dependent oxidoreductase
MVNVLGGRPPLVRKWHLGTKIILGKNMKYGLFGINNGICSEPETMKAVSIAAEAAGFESLWTGEHVVLPDPQEPPSPAPPLTSMVHPSTALSYIAGFTSTIKLATGITLLAQRNAVVLAKEMASLDYLSNGRLIFGIGAGYLKAEFDALGVNFAERGARSDEYIDAMRELWTSQAPEFSGQFVNFSGIQSRPQPVQVGGPDIVVGGTSDAAYRRAVTKAQGWYGFALDYDLTASAIEGLAKATDKHSRASSLGDLEISITPRARLTDEMVQQYESLGVRRLVLLQTGRTRDALLEFVRETSESFFS